MSWLEDAGQCKRGAAGVDATSEGGSGEGQQEVHTIGEVLVYRVPCGPDNSDRIERQKAAFMRGVDVERFRGLGIEMAAFRQRPGDAYKDKALGISREDMYPDKGGFLQCLANKIKEKYDKSPKVGAQLLGVG